MSEEEDIAELRQLTCLAKARNWLFQHFKEPAVAKGLLELYKRLNPDTGQGRHEHNTEK